MFSNIVSFNQQVALVRTVRRRYLTPEVADNFIQILESTPAAILPAPCDFIVRIIAGGDQDKYCCLDLQSQDYSRM